MWRRALALVLLSACDCGSDPATDSCLTDTECGDLQCINGRCAVPDRTDGATGRDAASADAPMADGAPTLDGSGDGTTECVELELTFTGAPTLVELPPSARFLVVKAWGAGGNNDGSFGGPGGFSSAIYEVLDAQALTAVVGRLGRNDGEEAFGFGARGGGGLSGLFAGSPPLLDTERERAIVIAGGGGSSVRDVPPAGGAGNRGGGMPTMAGGNATVITPDRRNENTGGGGGYEGGIGRQSESTGGTGGTGIVVDEIAGLRLLSIGGVPQSIVEASDTMFPPRQDDAEYPGTVRCLARESDCAPGEGECCGYMVIRALCDEPPALI